MRKNGIDRLFPTKNYVRILSLKNQLLVAEKCRIAVSFKDRLVGLIGTQELKEGQGLLLNPCNDIHMWMMSVAIDVVFLRQEPEQELKQEGDSWVVTSVREGLRPWKFLPVRDGKASITLELPIGTIKRCQVHPGDKLCLS